MTGFIDFFLDFFLLLKIFYCIFVFLFPHFTWIYIIILYICQMFTKHYDTNLTCHNYLKNICLYSFKVRVALWHGNILVPAKLSRVFVEDDGIIVIVIFKIAP